MGLTQGENHKRIRPMMLPRTVFAMILGLGALGMLSVTLYLNFVKLKITSNYVAFWKIQNYRNVFVSESDMTNGSKTVLHDMFDNSHKEHNNSMSITANAEGNMIQVIATTTNQTKALMIDSSVTTAMTFDKTLVVFCKQSPFIECLPPVIRDKQNKRFKVTLLKQPWWHPKSALDINLCPYQQCDFTQNTISKHTDLVVVYGVNLRDSFTPPQRWRHQLYAINLWESPVHTNSEFMRNNNSIWNRSFNLTMTYRVDSDIFSPYRRLKFNPIPLKKRPNYYDIAKVKSKSVVWIVSNCKTSSRREEYVKEMQKYIDVDVFGGCGSPCPKGKSGCDDLLKNYKFYLSFENSLCNDYISEKFFKMFSPQTYILPVVRGGANYSKYFSNFTFINTADFSTAKDLALFLKELASNLETYSKYLEYKDLYINDSGIIDIVCSICEYLHTHTVSEPRTYNLHSWLQDGQCYNANDI